MTSPTSITDLQAAVARASDNLADALAADVDTTEARAALAQARAALRAHQDALRAVAEQAQAAAAVDADNAAARAVSEQTAEVDAAVARVTMPETVATPAPVQHAGLAQAAAEVARIRLQIERGSPERRAAQAEVDALVRRADAKRVDAAAIRSRRLAGHEAKGDAEALHLLEADAADLDNMVQAARQRLSAQGQPVTALRQQLAEAEKRLATARIDAELHGQAERLRAIEGALIEGWRELRRNALGHGRTGIPQLFTAHADLRKVAYGQAL